MSEAFQIIDSLGTIGEIEEGTEQYLTFFVADEEYGVELLRVQEIKGWERITSIPNTPHYLCGVLNLRGAIVPVVDLRLRFELPFREYTPTTVVVVLRVEGTSQRTVGIVVDGVSDTCNVLPENIKPAPNFGGNIKTDYIKGLVTIKDEMVMLLEIDQLLSVAEIG
jgi:purine-binding chemotaxis protein CheW